MLHSLHFASIHSDGFSCRFFYLFFPQPSPTLSPPCTPLPHCTACFCTAIGLSYRSISSTHMLACIQLPDSEPLQLSWQAPGCPPWAYIIPICILFAGRWVLLLCVWPPASVASLPREKEQAQRVARAASLFHRLFIRRVLPCSVLCPRLKEPLAQLVSFSRAPSD